MNLGAGVKEPGNVTAGDQTEHVTRIGFFQGPHGWTGKEHVTQSAGVNDQNPSLHDATHPGVRNGVPPITSGRTQNRPEY